MLHLMSDKERPKISVNGVGSGGGEGGTSDDEDDPESKKCEGCGKRGKGVSLFRRKKGKKLHNQRKKQKGSFVNSGWKGVSCFKKPQTLDSSGESPTSDPNSSEFTFDKLRGLIEKNEFYSKECNPHLDATDG